MHRDYNIGPLHKDVDPDLIFDVDTCATCNGHINNILSALWDDDGAHHKICIIEVKLYNEIDNSV